MPVKVSVIIPTFNEEAVIKNCLESLIKQTYKDFEIIIIDDGSSDKTLDVLSNLNSQISNLKIFKQEHLGPGSARNLGVNNAEGKILVFVDADMVLDPVFIQKLIYPIEEGKVIGTFTKEEYLFNKDNIWARFWNINLGRSPDKMHPDNYPDTQPVFRAILKSEFIRVAGFNTAVGYTDDWSLSRKLGIEAVNAPGAIIYHKNPNSLKEVWNQARWFGKNEFLTKNLLRKIYNLLRYNLIFSLIKGIFTSLKIKNWHYLKFKVIYDSAVSTSVLLSFFGEQKYK